MEERPTPPGLSQRSASEHAICEMFILAQLLPGSPTLIESGKRGGRRGKVRAIEGSQGGIENLVPQSMLCKENTPGPAKAGCHTACHHPTWLPKLSCHLTEKSHFTLAGRARGGHTLNQAPEGVEQFRICVQSRYRAWLQGRQCKSPVRLGALVRQQ